MALLCSGQRRAGERRKEPEEEARVRYTIITFERKVDFLLGRHEAAGSSIWISGFASRGLKGNREYLACITTAICSCSRIGGTICSRTITVINMIFGMERLAVGVGAAIVSVPAAGRLVGDEWPPSDSDRDPFIPCLFGLLFVVSDGHGNG